jgi:hypothetical protein
MLSDRFPDPLSPHLDPNGSQAGTLRVSFAIIGHGDSPPMRDSGFETPIYSRTGGYRLQVGKEPRRFGALLGPNLGVRFSDEHAVFALTGLVL